MSPSEHILPCPISGHPEMANPVRGKCVSPLDLMLPCAEPAVLSSCWFSVPCQQTRVPNAVLSLLCFLLFFGDLFLIEWMQAFPAVMEHRGFLVCFLFLLALWVFCELVLCGMLLPV